MEVRVKWELDVHFSQAAFNFVDAEREEQLSPSLLYLSRSLFLYVSNPSQQ